MAKERKKIARVYFLSIYNCLCKASKARKKGMVVNIPQSIKANSMSAQDGLSPIKNTSCWQRGGPVRMSVKMAPSPMRLRICAYLLQWCTKPLLASVTEVFCATFVKDGRDLGQQHLQDMLERLLLPGYGRPAEQRQVHQAQGRRRKSLGRPFPETGPLARSPAARNRADLIPYGVGLGWCIRGQRRGLKGSVECCWRCERQQCQGRRSRM